MALVEVSNASFDYGSENIFDNLSFEVNRGEVFCLLGPNGSGKSTLLECVMGLLKLKRGTVRLDGKNIERLSPQMIARYVSYVPQIHEKSFPYTVLEFVLMGRASYTSFFSAPGNRDISIAEEALAMVGMEHFKERPYTQLSGGELQLVIIARALAQKTPVVIMDEPTSHLDFKNDTLIMEKICCLVNERGLTIIMATHFPNHGFYFENNALPVTVYLMGKGKVVGCGRPSEVFSEENMKEAYEIESKIIDYPIGEGKLAKQIIPLGTHINREKERI